MPIGRKRRRNFITASCSKIEVKKEKPEKYNPAVKPLFKTSRERYEYLMKYGCTCNDDRVWFMAYKDSKEYKQYETVIC